MPAPFFPTFAGNFLFGPSPTCIVRPNPVGRMTTAYPGVIGIQSTMMGGRGYSADISGILFGVDLPSLAVAFAAIEAFHQDGGSYAFTDSMGSLYPQAVMGPIEQSGPILPWDDTFGFGRSFRCSVLILK